MFLYSYKFLIFANLYKQTKYINTYTYKLLPAYKYCLPLNFLYRLMVIITCRANQLYNVTEYEHQPGILFEPIGEVKITNSNWKLITFVNIKSLNENFYRVSQLNQIIENDCHKIGPKSNDQMLCAKIGTLNKIYIPKIKQKLETIKHLIGHKENIYSKRMKRGWFDVIGKGLKVIFGTLDIDDAQFYNDKINDFQSNEESLAHTIKDQSTIVKSAISNFNQTISMLSHNEEVLVSNLEGIATSIQQKEFYIKQLNEELTLGNYFLLIESLIHKLVLEVNTLTEGILLAQRGLLHPDILTPKEILDALIKIQPHLKNKLSFPIDLTIDNIYLLMKVIEVECFYLTNNLIFNIIIPLVDFTTFQVNNIIPFPAEYQTDQNLYIYIQPHIDYIALDENKRNFVTWTQNQFDKCKALMNKKYICNTNQPVKLINNVEMCELKLILGFPNTPKTCDSRIIHLKESNFIKLSRSNTWVFSAPYPESITLNCDNIEPFDIKIRNTGTLTVNKNCKAFSSTTMLSPSIQYNSNISKYYVPSNNLKDDCCDEILKKNINISEIVLNSNYKKLNFHTEDLKIASHKLDEISKAADDIINNNKSLINNKRTSLIGIILGILFVIYMIYKTYKYWNKKTNTSCCLKNLCIKVEQNVTPPQSYNQRETVVYKKRNSDVLFDFTDPPRNYNN